MLGFITNNINYVINIAGVIIAILAVFLGAKLSGHKKSIEEALHGTKRESKIDSETGKQEVSEKRIVASPEEIRMKENNFQRTCSWNNTILQLIPIFPLLGILGTVAGLIIQVNAGDVQAMMDSLGVALNSTFYGLLWSIGLKFFIAIGNSRIIYATEALYSSYDKEFNANIGLKNVTK